MEYLVLYTHQKTKKAKTWHDGVLSVTIANRAVLYDDKKTKLDSMYIKPEAIVKGEQLESDRYFILIEDEKSTVQTIVEPARPVTCPVRVPVRTGLKRKRTGFVPPRLVKQSENEGNQLVPQEPSSRQTSYLDLLRNKRTSFQNESANSQYLLQLNSSPHNTETPLFLKSSKQQSFLEKNNSLARVSEQALDSQILSAEKSSPRSNQLSPWSSYGNKLKSLHSPGKSLHSPGKSEQICSEINAEIFLEETSPRTDKNDKSSDYKNICSSRKKVKSENTNFIQNDIMGSSDVNKYEKSVSGGLKSYDETTSEEQNSKRSMTQIMALLGKKKSTPSTLYHVMEPNKKEEEYSNSNKMKNRSNNIHNTKNKDYNIIDGEHRKKQVERLKFSNTEMVGNKMSPNYNQKLSIEDNDSKQYLNDSLRSSQEWCSVRVELSPLTPNIGVENHNRTEKEETVANKMESSTDSKLETSDGCKPLFLSNDSSEVLSPFHQITDYSQNKLSLKTTLQGCNKTNTSPGRQDKRNNTLHRSSEHDKEDLFIVDEEYMVDTNDDLAVSFDMNFSPLSYVSDSDSVIDTAERHSTVGNPAYLSHSDSVVTSKDGDYAILENNSTYVCDVMNPKEIDMKEQFIDKKSDTCSNLTKDNFEDSDKNSNPTESRENTNMTPNGCSPEYTCTENTNMTLNECSPEYTCTENTNMTPNGCSPEYTCTENTNMTPNGCSPEYTCTENTNINIDDKGVNKSYLSNSNDDQPKTHLGSEMTININYDSINIQEYSKLVESNSSIHHSVDLDMGQEENKSADLIEDVAENSINTTKSDDNTVISPKGKDLSKSICFNKTEPYNNEITCKQNIHKDISCHKNDLKSMSNCDILTENNETTEKQIQDHSSTANLSYIPNEVSITDSLSQNDLSLPSVGEQTNDSIEKESHMINCNFAKDLQTDKKCEMEEKDTLLDEHFPVKSLIDLNFSPDSFHLSDESINQNTCAQKSIIKDSALCLSKKFSESYSFSENQLFQEEMNENKNNFNHSNANMNLMSENCQQICSKINFTSESASSLKSTDNYGTFQQQHLNEQDSICMLNDTFESLDQNTSVQECSEKEYYITDNISQTTDKGDNLSQSSTLNTALTDSQCQPDNYNKESEFVSQIGNEKQIKHSRDQRKQRKCETLESENFVRGDNSPTSGKNFVRENFSSELQNFTKEDYSVRVDYPADYRENSARGDYFADCYNSERRDFSPESRTHSLNVKSKMKPSVQGLSDHDLKHPDDIFAKKNQMTLRPDHVGSEELPMNCQIQNQSDLRCTASEKLESYIMRGSVTSCAVRRKDSNEKAPMTEDESFYIDLSDDKPRLKSQQMSSIMLQSSPAQFVPNTPEFLKSLKTRGSSQNSSGKSSQEELIVSGDTDYLDYDGIAKSDLKSLRFLTYSNQIIQGGSLQQIVDNENQPQFLKSAVSQQRKMKIPLVSAPDDILTENGNNSSVNKLKSHDEGVKQALFDRNFIKDNGNGCNNVEVAPNFSESDSDISSPMLTYWENKLLQRQKCGNIFITNDQESSQSSLENWETKDKCHYVNDKENILYKNQYADSSGPFNSNIIRFSNSVKQNQVQHTDKVRNYDDQEHECIKINVGRNSFHTTSTVNPKTEKCENNILKENENQGSKWGKYADFDDEADEADDFLTFDQSFSVPGVTDQAEKPTISLRPWTKHNETFNGDESSDVPELTDHKENPVISLRPWTKCNDRFSMLDMPHQAEKHTISLQPAKSQDNFDFSDSNPSDAIKGSQSFNKNEVIASSQKFQSTSHNIKEQFLSRHISEKQYLSPVIASSKSNRYQIANNQNFNQNTQSTITRTNEPNFSYGNPSNVESMEEDSVTCVPSSDNYNPGKRFKCPVPQLTSCILKGTKRNLGSDLQFPSIQEITENSQLVREIEIPTRFTSLGNYKQVFTAALKEHLNIILFDLGVKYHHALSKIDTTSYLPTVQGKENKGTVNSNPVCKCGAPSKMIQVKKSGPNHNRFFYACYAARNSQCKFFQWADEKGGGQNKKCGIDKQTMSDPASISTFIKSHHLYFYCDCTFVKKSTENIMTHFRRNTPNWVKQKMGMDITGKKKMYIQLSRKDNSGLYSKDDLWIISRHLDFRPSSTVLCKSTYYGPTSGNEVEIEPIASFCPSNWSNGEKCHAILAGNVSGELSYLVNLEENVTITDVPVLQSLLASNTERSSSTFTAPLKVSENTNIYVPESCVDEKVEELIDQYKLNEDQSTAFIRVARMFTDRQKDILLIHGVFGAGKSFLLSVVVVFLVWLFERNDTYTPGVPFPWKLLIASTTNVAVDRILNGLLAIGFEEFVRVGSVKKISKPILPFSVHATGSDSQELKDLQMMLRSGELTATEKQNVKQSIEKHKLGENKKKLSKVRVVGVTCASCSANTLKDMKFPIVLLDECSQMTEPASMLPVAKFKCQKLVLVGDPKQLDPTIQGSETSTVHGLEQTLFDRLTLMGHSPVMLHTQYRCHPYISQVSNSLFYNNVLRNGISVEDRDPVMDELPALCFYDVSDGLEINDRDGSFYNDKETQFIMFLIEVLVDRDVDPDRIGVISLYKSQMYKITNLLGSNKNCKELKGVMVSTVDAFQGGERDVIILSCVRTRNVGFIDNEKRTNVALTRAKHHLLIVGNENNLTKNKLWYQIIHQCKDSSPQGLQSADVIREIFKLEPKPTESSQKKKRNHNNQEMLTDDASSSPPMSLTDSCKSSLSTESSNIQQLVPEFVSLEKGDLCSEERDFKEDLTYWVPGSAGLRQRRKRRKIDPSLLEIDENYNSDDEELPNIFNS